MKQYSPAKIFDNSGVNSDSKLNTAVPKHSWLSDYTIDQKEMHPILSDCRVYKSAKEIEVLRWAN